MITIRFAGVERACEIRQVTDSGLRTIEMRGSRGTYHAVEKAQYPGHFFVLNTNGRCIGGLIEKGGKFRETR